MKITCLMVMASLIGGHAASGQLVAVPGLMSPFTGYMVANPMTHNGRYNNFMGVHGNNPRSTSLDETFFTAIGYDTLDHDSQMRLTIRPRAGPGTRTAGHTGGWDTPLTWYVQGSFSHSDVLNKAGNYYLVITENGRTRDGCDPASLGRAIGSYSNMRRPLGVLPNKVMLTELGDTVFASKLTGVSRSQLAGAGIAVCQHVTRQGYCSGVIQFCGTISKDNLPAGEKPGPVDAFGYEQLQPVDGMGYDQFHPANVAEFDTLQLAPAFRSNQRETPAEALFNSGTQDAAAAQSPEQLDNADRFLF